MQSSSNPRSQDEVLSHMTIDQSHVFSAIVDREGESLMDFHKHDRVEITAVLDGNGLFHCEDTEYMVESGDIVVIPSQLHHRYYAKVPMRFACLDVNTSLLPADLFSRLTTRNSASVITLKTLDLEQYESMFRQWLKTVRYCVAEQERFTKTWVELFLLFLLQHAKSGRDLLSIANAAEYLKTHLDDEVQITQLASLAGLSDSAFRGLFKKTYGITPREYQRRCRIDEAKRLIRSSDKLMQDIAEKIGFASLHAFSAWFQKNVGASPTRWRKENANIVNQREIM